MAAVEVAAVEVAVVVAEIFVYNFKRLGEQILMTHLKIKNSSFIIILLVILVNILFSNCKTVVDFDKAFDRYERLPPYKAMAYAKDSGGHWAYGYAEGQYTQESANELALYECERRLAKYKVLSGCKLYAVGDTIVWKE